MLATISEAILNLLFAGSLVWALVAVIKWVRKPFNITINVNVDEKEEKEDKQ